MRDALYDALYMERFKIEEQDQWRESIEKIPFLKFPADWQVQVIPPFAGAMARFRVRLPSGKEKSVYLDFYDRLGYCGFPYWEVYPYDGDVGRCAINETEELLRVIGHEDTTPDRRTV